jgi:hypothetical protein
VVVEVVKLKKEEVWNALEYLLPLVGLFLSGLVRQKQAPSHFWLVSLPSPFSLHTSTLGSIFQHQTHWKRPSQLDD